MDRYGFIGNKDVVTNVDEAHLLLRYRVLNQSTVIINPWRDSHGYFEKFNALVSQRVRSRRADQDLQLTAEPICVKTNQKLFIRAAEC